MRGAVEDVVGRHVDDVGARPRRAASATWRVPRALTAIGPVGVALAGVDRRPGPGVDDDLGAHALEDGLHGVAVGDVEQAVVGGDHLAAAADAETARGAVPGETAGRHPPGEGVDEVGAELAARAGDEHPHDFAAAHALSRAARRGRPRATRRPTRTRPPGPGP